MSGRCKPSRICLPLILLLLVCNCLAGAEQATSVPDDYVLTAQSTQFNLYLKKDTLAVILESRKTGNILTSTVQNADEMKDNATWKGFYQSGVVMEYIEDVKSTNSQADFINTPNTVTVQDKPDGFTAHVLYTDIGISYDMDVVLDEEGLTVQIPQSSIHEEQSDKYTVSGFYLYPFLGHSYLGEDEGYMIIPDGQGALIPLKDNEGRFTSPFDRPVYGTNIGVEDTVNSRWNVETEPVIMPVFGMVHSDKQIGFLGVIEQGDCAARIMAYPNGVRMNFDWICAKYIYRRVYAQPTGPNSGTISTRTEYPRKFDIVQHFLLREGEDANYTGLAVAFREYLERKGFFEKAGDSTFDLAIDFLGLEKENYVLGKTDVVMTSFSQAGEILEELSVAGVDKARVGYRGWISDGLTGGVPTDSFSPASSLGGKNGLSNLLSRVKALGMEFSLEADFLSLNIQTHPALSYSAFKKITSQTYSRATFGPVYDTMYYLLPDKSQEISENVFKEIRQAGVGGVSLKGITSLMSDYYYQYHYKDASVLMGIYRNIAQRASSELYTVVQAPNMYLWPYAQALADIPVTGSDYTYVSNDVPFLAIALSGKMPVYLEYVNFQANNRAFFLHLVEQGTRPCFLLTQEDPIKLQNTNSADIYSSRFDLYRYTVVNWYQELKDLHARIGDASIKSHEIQGQMTKVTWTNGLTIYLNFGETQGTMDGQTLEALSWKAVN